MKDVTKKCKSCGREFACQEKDPFLCPICFIRIVDPMKDPNPRFVTQTQIRELALILIGATMGVKGYSFNEFQKMWDALTDAPILGKGEP